jgi:nicotinamidase/pyrazinamidase
MSLTAYILISLLAAVLIFFAALMAAFRKIYTPTKGKPIIKYTAPKRALLVIDVQEDYTGLRGKQPVPFRDVDKQIAAINRLIENSSQSGLNVICIRQIFANNPLTRLLIGRAIEGMAGTELDARIKVINQNNFTKRISDAFSNPEFEEFLISNQIDELYLAGLDAAYCVYATAMGAANRGYKVRVITDAVMSRKKMEDVMARCEKNGITAVSSNDIIVP